MRTITHPFEDRSLNLSGSAPPPAEPLWGADEPFVGRRRELERLEDLLAKSAKGAGSVVFLTGDSGIGKTMLAGELLRRACQKDPSLILCRGRCAEQYGTGEAYLPFLDLLGTLLVGPERERTAKLLRTYAPTWCLQLPAATPTPASREALQQQTIGATKERMVRELGDVFEAAGALAPVVVLLEDLEWADPSSIDLLRHLGNRIARQRMIVLATYRPADLQARSHPLRLVALELRVHAHCHEIALGPFGEEQVAEYLHARFAPHRLPVELSGLIHRRTEGHPLFVTSFARFLVARGDIAQRGDNWELARSLAQAEVGAPENVRAMILRKVEELPEADRAALQYASVMGKEFLSTVLAALLEVDEVTLEERLERVVRLSRLIETVGEEELPDGALATRYRFANALHREVLYEELVSKRRIALHRQVGERLARHYGAQASRIAAQLALHFERGREFAGAVTYATQAGDAAAEVYAQGEAEEHYALALRLLERLPAEEERPRALALHGKLGAVHLAVGRFDRAAASYGRMLELAAAAQQPERECAALSGLCNALFYGNRIEETAVRAEEALEAAERTGQEELMVGARLTVALILQHQGQLAQCRPLLDGILSHPPEHRPTLLQALTYRGTLHYWQSEYVEAEARIGEALALASEQRDGRMMLIDLMMLGLARGNLGRVAEALSTLGQGLDMARRNGEHFWLPRLANNVGWIHRELQDFQGAISHDLEGLEVARGERLPEAEASALLNLAIDHTLAGDAEQAAAAFAGVPREREAWFGWFHEIRLAAALAERRLRLGELDAAADEARRLLEAATRVEARTYVVTAHVLLAEVARSRGEPGVSAVHLVGAIEQLQGLNAPFVAWKAHAALGRLHASQGDSEAAVRAFVDAAEIVRLLADSAGEGLRTVFLASPAVREVLDGAGGGT